MFKKFEGVRKHRGSKLRITAIGSVVALWLGSGAGSAVAQMGSNQMPNQTMPGSSNGPAAGQMPQNPAGGPMGRNGQNPQNGLNQHSQMMDQMFLQKAAEGGMAEVQLGQLAASNGGSQEVKDFGQQMVTDHAKLNDAMMPIAQSMGVATPEKLDKKDRAEMTKLQGLTGAAFDKEYLNCMVKDHKADVRDFKGEMASTTDPALRSAVADGEKVIEGHLMMVEKLQKQQGSSTAASK